MEDASSLEYLYKAVLKDFILVFVKIMKEKDNSDEKKGEEELKFDNINIKELLKYCLNYIKSLSLSNDTNSYYPQIYELINKYLNDINEFLEGKDNIENFPILKVGEHDIYLAYGILGSIRIITGGLDLQEVSKFNYKECSNIKSFIDVYGNSKNLTKIYETNFKAHQKDKKKLDLKLINNCMKKLDEKQLSPMIKKNRKKKNKDKNKIIDENNKNKDNKEKINEDKNEVDVNQEKKTSVNHNTFKDNEKSSLEVKNEIKESNIENENKNTITNSVGKNNDEDNKLKE